MWRPFHTSLPASHTLFLLLFFLFVPRVPFSIFLYVLGINGLFAIYFSVQIYQTMGLDWVMYISLTVFTIFFISGLVQLVFQVRLKVRGQRSEVKAHRRP